jgi:AraC family transcriptional regulator of adaptative response / DNA-3-methyladenine glycosylase II
MRLRDDVCYRALRSSDRRFDGLFFVGVETTGIYCRPVCPARTPRRDRCTFYACAAAAEADGFRPCLRCRPELAPGSGAYADVSECGDEDVVTDVVAGAVTRIHDGALNGSGTVTSLAAECNLSARQLRRVVRAATGAAPIELAQTCRLLLAKQLLSETALPMTQVALASGFSSLRRFNQAFAAHYRLSPTRLRRSAGTTAVPDAITLRLAYRSPFDWAALLAFLAPRCIAGVEEVADDVYRRTVHDGMRRGWLEVRQASHRDELMVSISAELVPGLQQLLERVRDLFDLRARPDVVDAHLAECPVMAPFVGARPGLRVPGAFNGFELAWRAILGQQVSVRGATTLAGRLAATFGEPIDTGRPELCVVSPTAARLAAAGPDRIAAIGMPLSRAGAVHGLACLLTDDPLLLSSGRRVDEVVHNLAALPGVGPWTTSYIAMRALGWPDALPEGDLGLRHALDVKTPRAVRRAAEAWRPWRAYAAMHLWTAPERT